MAPAAGSENRRFQEPYLRLKTLHWRHLSLCVSLDISLSLCSPLPSPRHKIEMDWPLLAGCLSFWLPLIMDLFEWIRARPRLYKYLQIMCPIIVFASSKQRSSTWPRCSYFYTGWHLMNIFRMGSLCRGPWLSKLGNSSITAECHLCDTKEQSIKFTSYMWAAWLIPFVIYISVFNKKKKGMGYDSSSHALHCGRHWMRAAHIWELGETIILTSVKSMYIYFPHVCVGKIVFNAFFSLLLAHQIEGGKKSFKKATHAWARLSKPPTIIVEKRV